MLCMIHLRSHGLLEGRAEDRNRSRRIRRCVNRNIPRYFPRDFYDRGTRAAQVSLKSYFISRSFSINTPRGAAMATTFESGTAQPSYAGNGSPRASASAATSTLERDGRSGQEPTHGSARQSLSERFYFDDQQLSQALGWFSVGLGLVEIFAPRTLGRAIGVGEHPAVMRLCGLREIVSGVGLLSQRSAAAFTWSRVAGDAMDLALLGAALRSPDAKPARVALAATAVAGVTALDVFAGQQTTRTALARAPDALPVKVGVTINSTPDKLYEFWRNFENLPRFMRHLQAVKVINEQQSHWIATAAGMLVEWDSEIVDDQPGKLIAWRTLPDSQVNHHGTVTFEAASGGRGTILRVELHYGTPGGAVGATLAKVLGEAPGMQIAQDLRRFKQLIETGEIATTRGQPSGSRSLLGRALLRNR
jgi:uncharacterized membrane protein